MAIRDEVRILKNNTLEELRQKSNELSIRNVGDDNLLSTHLGDKTESFTATSSQKFFELTGRFEVLPEQTIDKTTGVAESYRVGAVRVTKQGTALTQGLASADFKVPNYTLKVTLTGSPTIPAQFVENATLTQSGGFSGVLLSADSTTLRFKSFTGTLNTAQNLGIPHTDAAKRVVAGNIASKADVDAGHGVLIELITGATSGHVIKVDSTSLVDAVNELQDDVGVVENLSTGSKVLTNAVNEHETDLYGTGNASFSGLSSTGFQDAIEELRTELGAHTSLGTTVTSNVVGAVNELETAVRGSAGNYTIGTDANDLVAAINEIEAAMRGSNSNYTTTVSAGNFRDALNEHESDIGTVGSLTTTGTNLVAAVNEHDAELGTITAGAMGTSASTVSTAIAELHTEIGNVNINSIASGNNTITGALSQLHTELGSASLNTNSNTHTGAINEHEADIGDMTFLHGVSGKNELSSTNISAALTELSEEKLDLINAGSGGQTVKGNMFYDKQGSYGTFKFKTGTVLDLSDATLLVSAAGGVANFGSAFLNLDANVNQMGIQVDRDHVTPSGSMTNHDVRLQWNESQVASAPDRGWQLIGMATNGSTNTADIVTFYNAQDLIASNTESGIAVTWDSTAQNFDFNVNDPTITLTGDVTGSATMTNLGNVSIAATVAANSVALGTDTTGNYISTIAGTSNEIEVSGSGSETATVTVGLPNDVTISGDLSVNDYAEVNALRVGLTGSDPGDNNFAVNGNATITGNTTITGNLVVNGTQTTLNTSTLEVEDTLVLAGSGLTSEPASGGFGLEAGPVITQTVNGAVSSSTSVTLDSGTGVVVGQGVYGTGVASGATVAGISGTSLTLSAASSIADGATLTFSHTTKASNVTASHSIVYNYATDRWEADGSLILSSATMGTADVSVNNASPLGDLDASKTLDINAGSGITVAGALNSNEYDITITNDDKGSSQLFYKTFTTDSGSAVASANNDTLTLAGGNAITTTRSGDTITIAHDDTSSASSVNNSGNTFIQDITLDGNGHITALGSASVNPYDGWSLTVGGSDKGNIAEAERVSFEAGSGLGVGYAATNNVVTFSHADTSSQASVDNSGTTFIQDVTLDTYGHVTGLGSGSFTLGNGQLTLATSGGGISGSDTFTANASANTTFTVTLDSSMAASNSTIVQRNASGYIYANYFHTTPNDIASGSITKIVAESGNDGFMRHASAAAVRSFLNVADGATNTTSPNNATITISAGTNLTGGAAFTTDQSANETITLNMATGGVGAGTYGSTADGTKIDQITVDAYGRVTAISTGATGTSSADTITQIREDSGAYRTGSITLQSGSNVTISEPSTGTFNIAATNTTYSNLNQFTNGPGYTTYTSNQATNNNSSVKFDALRVGDTTAAPANTIQCTGDVVAYASSDERLKDNLSPISNSLEKIGQLKGYEFDWNDKQDVHSGHDVGVIAQEVEKVVPEIVDTREHDGYKAVKYEKLVPLLINAINDLKAEVEELKSINKKV